MAVLITKCFRGFFKKGNSHDLVNFTGRFNNFDINKFINLEYTLQKQLLFTSGRNYSEKKLEKPGFKITKVITEDGVTEKKTKLYVPKITLFTPENDMQVISLDDANKLAKRRNLKLVKVSERDPKTDRSVYKLVSIADYVKNVKVDKNKNNTSKDEKMMNISARIAEHDLQSKIKHIVKWLAKEQPVRLIITGNSDNLAPAEDIYNLIVEGVNSSGRIVQRICKNGEIKFQVLPPKKPKVKKTDKPEESPE